jgi:predicted membrane protein
MRRRYFMDSEFDYGEWMKRKQRNRMFFGFTIVLIGVLLFLRTIGVLDWLNLSTTWPLVAMAIGLLLGIKSGFRNNVWWILMIVGVCNFTPQFQIFGKPSTHFVWPAIVILGGLAIALKPRRAKCYPQSKISSTVTEEGYVNIDVTFGGKKEIITSKDFRGGAISITFGGGEINLSQADFTAPEITIDVKMSFGGLELIVPSNWEIKNQIVSSFGAVEDERTFRTAPTKENSKTLILTGTCSFGSVEIKSY